jgi:hypothetical protein
MAQEFLVETFTWGPGLKKKEFRFDTLDQAKAFADQEADHNHIIKVWDDNDKNVYTKRTLKTLAEDPNRTHTDFLVAAKSFAQKGELNPRFVADTALLAGAADPSLAAGNPEPLPMTNVLPMPPEPDLNPPMAPGGEPFAAPENMPE